jgi:serine/threonine-protein kinase
MQRMPRTFTLVRTLGRGAHGAVHLAEMRDDEAYVQTLAIKRLLPEWSTDPDLVARLKDEARLLALLHHEHVVRVHGLTRVDGGLAILMEPVDGVDLGKVVARSGALAPRVTLEIVRAVAEALDAAWTTAPPGHEPLHVVHRDIKPSNVMLTPRGGVKVMDFGVARADFESREGETRSQQFGTARYMAPERWIDGRAEHVSDVFSLGVTLIEIASGASVPRFRLSPDGFAQDLGAALATVKWEPLRELAARMAAFSPTDRPTAAEVVTACDALLADAPGPALRTWAPDAVVVGSGEPLDPTVAATVVREDSASRASRPIKQDNRGWAAVFLGFGLAAILITWAAGRSTPASPAPPPEPEPVVAEVEPAPVPEPTPAPEPVRVEVVAPAPAVVPPSPRPRPAPAPPPPPPPPPDTVAWMVTFDEPGMVLSAGPWGRLKARGALQLPKNEVVGLDVTDRAGKAHRCEISVGGQGGHLRISKDGKCIPSL